MRVKGLELFVVAAIVGVATPALAQDKKFDVNIGGGFTATTGEVHNHLGNGGNFRIGATFHVNEHLGIQFEYGYEPIGSKEVPVPAFPIGSPSVPVSAGHHMHSYTFNAINRFGAADAKIRPYAIGGVGIYNRVVQLTSPGTGLVTVCDPWWYICYPGGFVPVENIVGERSSTDMGIVFGGGVQFGVAMAEVRYHYIWGPEVQQQTIGSTTVGGGKANGQFLQVSFGVRF